MPESECPVCGAIIELAEDVEDGDQIACTSCRADLVVVETEEGEFVLEEV